MSYSPDNALIIQSDRTVLLDVHARKAEDAQSAIAPFAELIKSPEHTYTYRLSPLSIWNARAAGMPVTDMVSALQDHAKYPMPESIAQEIAALGDRYGLTTIKADTRKAGQDDGGSRSGHLSGQKDGLLLQGEDKPLAELLKRHEQVEPLLGVGMASAGDKSANFLAESSGINSHDYRLQKAVGRLQRCAEK